MAADDADDKKEATGGGKKKLMIMILAGLLLGGGGVGGTLHFMGLLGGGSGEAATEDKAEQKEAKTVPIYFAFPQAFTVNFETEQGLRFLQVSLEVMSYEQAAIDAVEAHMPVIKNNIILLLSNQSFSHLVSSEGKKDMRQKMLNEIQGILDKYQTDAAVEEIYFTNFVMQ